MEKERLQEALVKAIKRLAKNKKIGLMLSGGIDSSVIAKMLLDNKIKFTAYTVDFGGQDAEIAKKLAKELSIKHKMIKFKGNAEQLIKKVLKIIKTSDIIDIGVAMPVLLAAEKAAKEGKDIVISGLGSDEILAGYGSHAKALEHGWKEVHKECIRRLVAVKKDIRRDRAICRFAKIKPVLPFMDKKVVDIAMRIHPKQKISASQKKIILREIAKEIRLPEYIYERPKKAAQYGSGSLKLLKKTAKSKGRSCIEDYIKKLL